MLPILLDLKIIRIYTIGVFFVLAFFWGAYILWRNIKLTSFKEEDIFDCLFVTLFGALFTARLFFVLLNFEDFGFSILRFILINGFPGLSLTGGLIGGFTTFFIYTYIKKLSVIEISDYATGPLLLALAIGKIGSFFAGSDVGSVTTFLLRVTYIGYEGTRHITALYEAFLFFVGFYIAQKILYRIRREGAPQGSSLNFFLIFYPLTQIILDNFKDNRLYFANLPFDIIAAGIVFIVATGYFTFNNKKNILRESKNLVSRVRKYGKKTPHKKTTG